MKTIHIGTSEMLKWSNSLYLLKMAFKKSNGKKKCQIAIYELPFMNYV